MGKLKKLVEKGKKLVKKAAKSKIGKDFLRKEKVLAAEMMEEAAKKMKGKENKKK